MLESGVGRAGNIHLATLRNFTKPGDTSSASRYFDEDIVDPPLEASGGEMPVPAGPGIGVDVVRERVEQYTISSEEFSA
jgi:O-succinylbenzoate synthase